MSMPDERKESGMKSGPAKPYADLITARYIAKSAGGKGKSRTAANDRALTGRAEAPIIAVAASGLCPGTGTVDNPHFGAHGLPAVTGGPVSIGLFPVAIRSGRRR